VGSHRLIVGVSGSSAPQLAYALLSATSALAYVETHLVVTDGALRSINLEMGKSEGDFARLADVVHDARNLAASISSGSFKTDGMVVIPCSMKTLAAIACGLSLDLVARAADVCLKERRKLVLVTRETPLNLVHIKNMEAVTLAGATVLPPVPAFYHKPRTVDDLLNQTVGKVLDQFDIEHDMFERWK
jgi:polyprenyl P-hydroxybenzoate/phenylacrylic acid decarboxylase-like protein